MYCCQWCVVGLCYALCRANTKWVSIRRGTDCTTGIFSSGEAKRLARDQLFSRVSTFPNIVAKVAAKRGEAIPGEQYTLEPLTLMS